MKANLYQTVLSYPKIKELLVENPDAKKQIIQNVDEIRGDFSDAVVGSVSTFLEKTFLNLYDDVNVHYPEGFDLIELKKKYHVVFVPNHQSHGDYIALTYLIFRDFGVPVYVAAGINLNFFPIGNIFKKSGAFFIRRQFSGDHIYKATFEAYIYFLLQTDEIVEFFFEGGRTRTGKLLKPRYGLFNMLLEAHSHMEDKPLCFIPVSIAHENVPEEKAHAREQGGGKKRPEKTSQLFKIFKLFSKKLGTVHINFSEGILCVGNYADKKIKTQEIAFNCFKAVGKGMPVTPSALLALILLDEPSGALTWEGIVSRAEEVVHLCNEFKVPMTPSLNIKTFEQTLKSALDLMINNKKIEVIKGKELGQLFYAIIKDRRVEVLFHKNMILHHFIVPGIINSAWIKIFKGEIKEITDLKNFLIAKRKELKFEFYLPSVREMLAQALAIISSAVGRKIGSLEDAFLLNPQELYSVARKVRRFATGFSYIFEAYYIGAISARYLKDKIFNELKFMQVAKDLFAIEEKHGRVIRYPESYSVNAIKNSLSYFVNQGSIKEVEGKPGFYQVVDKKQIEKWAQAFAGDLNDHIELTFKMEG